MSTITKEQQERMEASRQRALAIKASKMAKAYNNQTMHLNTRAVKTKIENKNQSTATSNITTTFKCSAIGGNRFLVCCAYNPKFVTVFKSISTRRFDPESKGWSFDMDDFKALENKLKNIGQVLPNLNNGVLVKTSESSLSSVSLNDVCRGSCVLISRQRFEVDIPYNNICIEMFKTQPSREYDAKSRRWSFALTDYNKLMSGLTKEASIYVEPLSSTVLQVFKDQILGKQEDTSQSEFDLFDVDQKIVTSLMPFQKDGVNFAISRNGRILLADDMGLGKTVQSICIAAYYMEKWPLLIICPSSVRLMWKEALLKWLPSQVFDNDIQLVLTGRDFTSQKHRVTIISYDLLNKKQKEFASIRYGVVILDESHFIKNFKTARARAATAVLKQAQHVLLLSGTPALSRPAELYTQLSVVRPDLFPNFHQFGVRYCAAKKNPWGWEYTGSSNMNELRLVLQETIMLRRTKEDVLTQLPPKLRRSVAVDVGEAKTTSQQRKAMEEVKNAVKQKGLSALEKHGILLQYFNETAHLKLPAVKAYVMDMLESDRKFLLFAHHRMVLDSVGQDLDKKKCEYIRIDGNTPSERRQSEVARFQEKSSCKVALLSITAANMGITLNAASLVIFAELFWNPGILVQAEDRCYRIGQRDVVNVHYLVAKGTADDYIWQMVKDKLEVLGKAGLNKTNFEDTETHVVKAAKKNNLLNYFQVSHDANGNPAEECDDVTDEDLLLLEALENAESSSDSAPLTSREHGRKGCDVTEAADCPRPQTLKREKENSGGQSKEKRRKKMKSPVKCDKPSKAAPSWP